MISALTVILNSDLEYVKIWIESLRKKSTLVSEVFVADIMPIRKAHAEEELSRIWGSPITYCPIKVEPYIGHTIGLHEGIKRSRNDILIFSDPDVFFYMHWFDRFMLELHEQFGLMFIGVTHWNWRGQAMQHFPTVVNMLVHKRDLPGNDFLSGEMLLGRTTYKSRPSAHRSDPSADGYWLGRGCVLSTVPHYPKPKLCFDTGCNLYEWALRKNGRWLAFVGTMGPQGFIKVFTTKNVNNFGLQADFGNKDLLYHQCRAYKENKRTKSLRLFRNAYACSE